MQSNNKKSSVNNIGATKFGVPCFSVIIPTFNRAAQLHQTLESLVNQIYKNFEVIICDDGSTDNSAEVVNAYKSKLDLIYLWEPNWGGPAHPRNIGIKAAKGEWICFLDSDDWWYPEKLDICYRYLADYNFIYHKLDIYSDGNQITRKKAESWELKGDIFTNMLINGNPINNSSVVVKKELLLKVNYFSEERELIFIEDFDCWLKISRIENKFYFISKSLGGYLIGDNATSASERTIDTFKQVYKKYLGYLNNSDRKKALSCLRFRIGILNYSMHRSVTAIKLFISALSHSPASRKLRCLKFVLLCYYQILSRENIKEKKLPGNAVNDILIV
jgi:glycosyltransferase involved in cell wall biosynthesis